MTTFRNIATPSVALGIFMTGSAAFADVTAQQVWGDWKDYFSGFGYQVTSNENQSGDTLTVSDIAMELQVPDDAGTVVMTIGEMSFSNNSDGTVDVSIPPNMPINFDVNVEKGEDVSGRLDYVTKGFAMNVSGDPAKMTHNFSAANIAVSLAELIVEGAPVDIGNVSVNMANMTGTKVTEKGNLNRVTQNMNIGAVQYDIDVTDPAGQGGVVMKGTLDSMSFDGISNFPIEMNTQDMAAMLAAGFEVDGGIRYENGTSEFEFNDQGNVVQGNSSSGGGALDVVINADQLHYKGTASDVQLNLAGNEIPLPINLAMAESGFNLMMPVSKGDGEQDFAFGFTMGDFTMSDMIWSIFDPTKQLPRDPATIALDLTGKAKLFFDLMDPEQMAKVEQNGDAPGELNALNLHSLVVSAAGAELTGEGAFTFDNSDTTTFDGMPAPTGAIDLKLVGGNGLLDRLIAMGLLPEDQAMGARMMMGLFAVPGDGEDTLNSKIEVTGDGQVKANGQRLK